jgi:hypothetical protein
MVEHVATVLVLVLQDLKILNAVHNQESDI